MFVRGHPSGYALWTGGVVRSGDGRCPWGEVQLLDLRGEFREVYRVTWGMAGSVLGGGVAVKYIPQGYAMVALAPDPTPTLRPAESAQIVLHIVGAQIGSPALPAWRDQILLARLVANERPLLAPIAAVSGVDLYLESLTGKEIRNRRLQSWPAAVSRRFGVDVREQLGKGWEAIEQLVGIRNRLAHGKGHMELLDEASARRERYLMQPDIHYDGEGALLPTAANSLRAALSLIRCVRELEANE
jgi:hypothetical protein